MVERTPKPLLCGWETSDPAKGICQKQHFFYWEKMEGHEEVTLTREKLFTSQMLLPLFLAQVKDEVICLPSPPKMPHWWDFIIGFCFSGRLLLLCFCPHADILPLLSIHACHCPCPARPLCGPGHWGPCLLLPPFSLRYSPPEWPLLSFSSL